MEEDEIFQSEDSQVSTFKTLMNMNMVKMMIMVVVVVRKAGIYMLAIVKQNVTPGTVLVRYVILRDVKYACYVNRMLVEHCWIRNGFSKQVAHLVLYASAM